MIIKLGFACVAWLCLSCQLASAQSLDLKRTEASGMQHEEWALQALYSPDGQKLISTGLDGRIRTWEAKSGKLLQELRSATGDGVLALAISPDGATLAAGDCQGRLFLWNLGKGTLDQEIKADARIINAVAFSPDGKFVVAGGSESKARVWQLGAAAAPFEIVPATGEIVSLAFTPRQGLLVIGTLDRKGPSGEVSVWNWQKKERIHHFAGPPAVRALTVSPDEKFIAATEFRSATNLFLLPQGEKEFQFEASMRAAPESDEPRTVALFDLEAEKITAVLDAELGAEALAFSPDGRTLACAGDHGVIFFDIGGRSFLECGRIDTQTRVDAIALRPDGSQLALAREREALADTHKGGFSKLIDPFLIAAVMVAKDGTKSSAINLGKGKSLTGGSVLETWALSTRQTLEDQRLWGAVRQSASGQKEKAQQDLEKLIADSPGFAEARRVLAILVTADDPAKGESLLLGSVKVDAACVACYRSLGDVQYKREDWADAAGSYKKALELKPEYGLVSGRLAVAYNAMARVLLDKGSTEAFKAAAQVFQLAIQLRPGFAKYYTNLATTYYFLDDFDNAIKILKAALELRPNEARAYYNLGHCYRAKGDRQNAIQAYRQYVALGEKGEEERVDRAKALIKELSKSH